MAVSLVEPDEPSRHFGLVDAEIAEDHAFTVSATQQRRSIHAAIKALLTEVNALARDGVVPDHLTRQAVQLDEMTCTSIALAVDLTTRIDERNAVFHIHERRGVSIVMIGIMPYGL